MSPHRRAVATAPAGLPALRNAIRRLHGIESKLVETVHVREIAPYGEKVWEGASSKSLDDALDSIEIIVMAGR